ncbi:hypothetical protein [Halopenitus persicus]|uniref:hypothetical protein n=1 Tax=Halopenitus persicus TaxID=1048396 RepID=UPI000BBB2697|nr:hypothetical protein [Halopenitus persicus]
MTQNDEKVLNGFVDDRTLQTTLADIEERVDDAFGDTSKHGPDDGDFHVADFVWSGELYPDGTITVNPEQDDGVVDLDVYLREDSAIVSALYSRGYRGSCVYVGRRGAVLDAVREVATWEETAEVGGDILNRHLD